MCVVLLVFLFGQTPQIVGQTPQIDTTQQQKEFLLSRLVVDRGFKFAQIQEWEKKLDKMSPSQIAILVELYEENQVARFKLRQKQQQDVYEAAVLNLQKMKMYRDYLAKQYQEQINMRKRELQLSKQLTNEWRRNY